MISLNDLPAVFLMRDEVAEQVDAIAREQGVKISYVAVSSLDGLIRAFESPRSLLISFGTNVLVPQDILETDGLISLNIHAASPEYPGRDPHHFAVYDGVTRYGATMHIMTETVDDGPIVDVELFDVQLDITPCQLLERADEAGLKLISRFFSSIRSDGSINTPETRSDLRWGPKKRTRADFIALCRIEPDMTKDEIARRLKATAMTGYNNLYIDVAGYRFRFDGYAE